MSPSLYKGVADLFVKPGIRKRLGTQLIDQVHVFGNQYSIRHSFENFHCSGSLGAGNNIRTDCFRKNHPQDGQQSVADTKSLKAEAQAKAGATFLLEQAKKDSQLWDATKGFVMPPKPSVLRLIDRNQDVMKQRFPDADQSISALIRIFELFWSHFASVQRQINDRISPLPGQFRSKLQYVLRSARPVDNLDEVAGSARALAEAETEWVIAQINRHVAAQPVSDKQLMDEADVNNKMALLDGMRLVERDLGKTKSRSYDVRSCNSSATSPSFLLDFGKLT